MKKMIQWVRGVSLGMLAALKINLFDAVGKTNPLALPGVILLICFFKLHYNQEFLASGQKVCDLNSTDTGSEV